MKNLIDIEGFKAEEKILQIANSKEEFDWKSFLYDLISKEGLDPWDIDLKSLSQKYLNSINELKEIDFNISGKLLTIAVFLLKTKSVSLVEKDLRGLDEKIAEANRCDLDEDFFEEDFEEDLEKNILKKTLIMKPRNPMARKRKVTILDLFKTLEKTIEQSNLRRKNIFLKGSDNFEYEGPIYERKNKDLKEIIEELYKTILNHLEKKDFVEFSHLSKNLNQRIEILEKFIPLLHLHNDSKIVIKQDKHFGEIYVEEFK